MVHTRRSTNHPPLDFIVEIERTASRYRRANPRFKRAAPRTSTRATMGDNQPLTMRRATMPNLNQQRGAIVLTPLAVGVKFEVRPGLVHLLPEFHGLGGEDPNKHLSEFHAICDSMRPADVTEEQIKLRCFPMTLKDRAKDWYYYLPVRSIHTWLEMERIFLDKYFPVTRLNALKREIANIEQGSDEPLFEYVERFHGTTARCPFHGYTTQDLFLYVHGGLNENERQWINAASQGDILNKTPEEAFELLARVAENSRQFGS